jgi:methyl-accepting chemotaxis protein
LSRCPVRRQPRFASLCRRRRPLGAGEASNGIAVVDQAANETGKMSDDVHAAAEELSQQASTLDHTVKEFLTRVRST